MPPGKYNTGSHEMLAVALSLALRAEMKK